jgi:serralysin
MAAIRDFDDILFRDPSTGTLGAFMMNNGHPTWESIGQAATNWQVVGVQDLLGNGTDDILVRDPNTGNLGAFIMNDGHPTWEGFGWAATNWQMAWTGQPTRMG